MQACHYRRKLSTADIYQVWTTNTKLSHAVFLACSFRNWYPTKSTSLPSLVETSISFRTRYIRRRWCIAQFRQISTTNKQVSQAEFIVYSFWNRYPTIMGKYKAFDKRSTKNVTKAGLRLKSIEMNMKKSAIRKAALAEG